MQQTPWFERKFSPVPDNGLLPNIIERIDGTPIRLQRKLRGVPSETLESAPEGKWSIKKEIGHLFDLEPLWYTRFEDIISNKEILTEADLKNTKTHQTDHNAMPLLELITNFYDERKKLVALLRNLDAADLEKSSKHPRLLTPMKIIDLAYFIAEHDDHHLARITKLID